ncbi:MAG: hypothetical protein J6B26_07510 [Agathobacter sp.]|nr:hypothetical protein [Agathobacter sp.]MBQ2283924.1 hypothetical protein [Agathobacter sp.]
MKTPVLAQKREPDMGKLIIDGNSVYEIDEECARKRKLPKECGIYEHLSWQKEDNRGKDKKKNPSDPGRK